MITTNKNRLRQRDLRYQFRQGIALLALWCVIFLITSVLFFNFLSPFP